MFFNRLLRLAAVLPLHLLRAGEPRRTPVRRGVHRAAVDAEDVLRFAWLYRRHMDREALLVLPFARETLAEGERAELGTRMAARRGAK